MGDNSVRVAVRVRPFNERERTMGAKVCISMEGTSTTITAPDSGKKNTFAFDYSYWSHDGFVDVDGISLPDGPQSIYTSQRKVFDDIGEGILKDAFEGYNCSLFAYGQTGAGKSYSMVGYGANRGIIPIICEEIFIKCRKNTDPNKRYQVTVSMLEIYNEQVRDLLNIKINPPGGLKVRTKPGIGSYVEKLTPFPVASYDEVNERMEEGTKNRTVASTKMNNSSSRAHTVFTIMFTTVTKEGDAEAEVTSKINLVDLAGSERADSTGATGDRLKEGCAINQSLSALGNVISALADQAMGKKKVFVPYRNSVLTRLLQDALGGNSKTIMIAALSPADVNYEETLSTLRYADRAKKIKNNVTKNENPTDRIIRELKEENERLLKLLSGKGIDTSAPAQGEDGGDGTEDGGSGGGGGDVDAIRKQLEEETSRKLQEQVEENQRLIDEMRKSWEQKLKESMERAGEDESGAVSLSKAQSMKLPHIINLHEDPLLSECVVYVFKQGVTTIGRKDAAVKQDIVISGLNVKKEHATVQFDADSRRLTITPIDGAKTFVNGDLVREETEMHEGDRLILGNNFVFRVHDPSVEEEAKHLNWAEAMNEFTTKQGLRLQQDADSRGDKTDAEESTKRAELEKKLAEMEAMIQREREQAKAALEQQRMVFEKRASSGEQVSAEELRAVEEKFAKADDNLSKELEKKKAMSETMLREEMKRTRGALKIEEQLGQLLPLLNEANQLANELQKNTKFEARLTGKPTQNKPAEVYIRVNNTVDGSVWSWSVDKFDNRVYMMREMYQTFMEYGPQEVPRAKDPFWDPPEPVEIGKAYVYLKALSQLVEIESSFNVVDFAGKSQGQLSVAIFPKDKQGRELDYLQSSEELRSQKDVNFLLRINNVSNIPAEYSNEVRVTFSFLDKEQHSTKPCSVKSTSPALNYERNFQLSEITEQLRQYLLEDAAVFEVRGFNDHQMQELKVLASQGNNSDANAVPSAAAAAMRCDQCEEASSTCQCVDCSLYFCDGCFDVLHRSAKKAGHVRQALSLESKGDQKSESAIKCAQCDEAAAFVTCQDCQASYCPDCNDVLHKSAKKAGHVRTPLDGAGLSPPPASQGGAQPTTMCGRCEEATALVRCADCGDINYCNDCNELLHKSAKKAGHVRQPL